MDIWKIVILLILLLLPSCSYDLDFTGFVYSPVSVNERFVQSLEWNDAHARKEVMLNSDEYSVMIAGDSHVGGTENLSRFLEIGLGNMPAMMAIAGDLTTGIKEDYEALVFELEAANTIPVCLVPGNHDLYFHGWTSFQEYFGSATYTFEVNTPQASDLFIFLDTGGGTLGGDQLDWLKAVLENERDIYRHAVVVTHLNFFRPRFTSSTNLLNEEILVLIDLFEKHQINIVVQGHDHKRSEEQFGHTSYITLDALKDGYKDASFLNININKDKLSYEFVIL
jgi:UDP-2,3-diacylglucosamine pyrophosphatase LpxH